MLQQFIFGLFVFCAFSLSGAVHAEEKAHASWGYHGEQSAAHWGDLDEGYTACKAGMKQSPINISQYAESELHPLAVAYQDVPLHVVNNGHTVQVNIAEGNTLTVGEKVYNLLQIHFHTPSEHYLDGAPYPMEAHLVHKAEDGTLAVVGVLMRVGSANEAIGKIWGHIPAAGEHAEAADIMISGTDLLPLARDYYAYEGSLTTPPCSEGVHWHVLKDPIEISQEQLTAFQALYPVNARPVQALNDRVVKGQ